jgi:hypothetical protein
MALHQLFTGTPAPACDLGFSERALAVMAGDDAAYEHRALERGSLQPGESYGYKAIFRDLSTGSPTNEGTIYRTRLDALIAGHTNPSARFLFERVEVVRTVFQERAAA